jgi:hypothetical protein
MKLDLTGQRWRGLCRPRRAVPDLNERPLPESVGHSRERVADRDTDIGRDTRNTFEHPTAGRRRWVRETPGATAPDLRERSRAGVRVDRAHCHACVSRRAGNSVQLACLRTGSRHGRGPRPTRPVPADPSRCRDEHTGLRWSRRRGGPDTNAHARARARKARRELWRVRRTNYVPAAAVKDRRTTVADRRAQSWHTRDAARLRSSPG